MNVRGIKKLISSYPGIILEPKEILLIAKTIMEFKSCNFLVFGIGNDTPLWLEINSNGKTVFLEDNKDWYDEIKSLCPDSDSYLIEYKTKLSQWNTLIDDTLILTLDLPEKVMEIKWDVILVDGPCGDIISSMKNYGVEPPGRMSSIYTASKIIRDGYVFVHDCDRKVERFYSDRYLYDVNLVEQTSTRKKLRKYKISK